MLKMNALNSILFSQLTCVTITCKFQVNNLTLLSFLDPDKEIGEMVRPKCISKRTPVVPN